MLTIRLQRIGKKGQAYFRVVAVEHTKKPQGEVLELLGSYDPHQKKFQVEKERIEYWVSKGAQVSPTVNNLLVNYHIWDKPKMQSWKPKKKVTSHESQVTSAEKSEEEKVPQSEEPMLIEKEAPSSEAAPTENESEPASKTKEPEPAAEGPATQ